MNKNGVKLLAAVAIISMVLAAVAIVLPSNGDVDAEITYTEVSTSDGLKEELDKETKNIHVISDGILTFDEKGQYSVDNLLITPGGFAIKLGNGVELTINESLTGDSFNSQVQLSNGSKITVNGTIKGTTIYGISDETKGIAGLGTLSTAEGNGFSTWVSNDEMFITGIYSGMMMTNTPGHATVCVPESTSLIANEVLVGPGFDLVVYGEISGSFRTSAGSGGAPTDSKIAFQEKSTIGKTGLVITGKGVLSGIITLDENEMIELGENVKLDATVNGPNNNSFSGKFVAGSDGVSITGGSLTIDGTITTGSYGNVNVSVSGDAIYIDGTVDQNVTLTIAPNTTVTIADDANFTNSGSIVNKGTLVVEKDGQNLGAVDNKDGSINTAVGVNLGTNSNISGNQPTPVGTEPGSFAMGDHLESDYTVISYAFLTQDLTIPEGITLTVKGTLALNGYNLIVKGTLAVESKGKVLGYETAAGATNGIVLSETGSIINAGTIGADTYVKIADVDSNASVVMKNVKGVEFALTKEIVEKNAEYTLTVSGEAAKAGSGYYLAIDGAYITDLVIKDLAKVESDYYVTIDGTVLKNGTLTIDSKAAVERLVVTLQNNAVITVNGEVAETSTVTMYNGSVANINGNANGAKFQAKTGEYPTYNEENGARNNLDTTEITGTVTSSIVLDNMKGVTIKVTSKTYTKADEKSYTLQMMNISGTPDFVDKTKGLEGTDTNAPAADIAIIESVYVATGTDLVLAEGMTFDMTGNNALIITDGTLQMTNEDSLSKYSGAAYSVKVPKQTTGYDYVYYYTNFDNAYSNIASAEDMKVEIKGGYEFSKTYTVAADQEIIFDSATISKDGKVIVEEDGTLSTSFKTLPAGIKGTLIVKDGASCKPVSGSYEVSSKDADGTWTYTSAELAISNAKAGDIIYITDDVTFTENVTIPEGVTLDIASGANVIASEDLNVNGKIVNDGTVAVTGKAIINGEVDNNSSFSITREATVTGNFTGTLTAANINAAKYVGEEDVYTSVASAIATTSAMDVPVDIQVLGNVVESSEITIAAGQILTITGEVTLKSIRMNVDSKLVIDGTLSADVIGATGAETTTGALTDTVITVKDAEDAQFEMKKNESTSIVTLYMDKTTTGYVELKGTITVTSGSVEIKTTITVSKDLVVKVSSGAELVIKNSISGTAKYFSNEGTLTVAATTSISSMNLGGTVDVRKDVTLTVTDITVTGKIDTAENAKVSITGDKYMYIGSTPETLGASTSVSAAVEFGDKAYVVVFNGSSFTNTNDVKMDSTSYSINDVAFAKVYIKENDTVPITVLNKIVNGLKDLKVTYDGSGNETYKWKSGSSEATKVGDYDAVNTTIGYAKADFTISAGPGLIVYIDDVLVNTTVQNSYEIGTHTITIYIDKGYEGTPVIKVNGNTVTDGKLVVTTEMLKNDSNMIVVTGATPSVTPTPTPIQPEKDDGMGLTDYLLIVLVILAAILVVVVAIRMMRS